MEAARWIRGAAPLAALAVIAGLGFARPPLSSAADPPWDPPPCPKAPPGAQTRPADAAWYRLSPVLDATGTLAGQRLRLGRAGGPALHIELPPESFASGPVGGRVVVGDDDGSTSRLRVVDAVRGCATTVAREPDVIRSALLAPDGATAWEHRVDRSSREDLGIWRRSLADGTAALVLPGLPGDARHGPTFTTDLRLASDGRLGVSSCGAIACRTRVLDPASGRVLAVDGTGPMLGIDRDAVVAWEACHGLPCPVVAVELSSGRRATLVANAGAAAVDADGATLVYEATRGSLDALDLRTGTRRTLPGSRGLAPVQNGSLATSGADRPGGAVLLATGGIVEDGGSWVIAPATSSPASSGEAAR